MTELSPGDAKRGFEWGHILTLIFVVGPFLALVYGIQQLWNHQVNARDLAICIALYVVTALGITVGFHRLLTHRSFVTFWPIRGLFLALGSMAVEGPAEYWVATHLEHHAKSDREGDPHSPREGFWHAHIGWMLGAYSASPDIYARHLRQDRLVQFISRTFFGWVGLSFALPALLDGWLSAGSPGSFATGFWHGFLWGGLVRVCLTHHITWSVNSICHTFGQRPFASTRDSSRNNLVVGILAMGEGWHNNHHAFPSAAYHGFRWWQIDVSGYVIRLLKLLGLADKIQMPALEAQERLRARSMPLAIRALALAVDDELVPQAGHGV
jgi:stearoyl-CoA desaturase (delta-9 desaturase)